MARPEAATLALRGVVTLAAPYYDHRMELAPDADVAAFAHLTVREREVLRRTALGETNAQMAAGLGVTVHAVKFHLHSIFRKLGVRNRTEAAAVYVRRIVGEAR